MQQLILFRRRRHLTQKDLAALLGIHYTQIWRWETGRRVPDANDILKLCLALGCSPNQLLGWST